ncbi:HDOD domain-containing protein [Massilia sp. GCM10020059]|uniref:HDOD domain-containing protein n=1 Tax=Massilia agrisoli TaxID=2892444 RepID=A0ABS8IVF8_9BURK|nr:HDOD domain-containing protein [Massilia agrisoli]MCC6072450.1 HDOD domain-containing protein [Massilia agrisoli]
MTTTANPLAAMSAETTLALLWERTRRQGDMPGFTKAISAILGAMRGEDEQEFNMTQTVLTDPVLTQKVLRLANSGMYSAFGQRVNTVSKAVLVLGTEAIGHLALGLKLIEELSKSLPDSEVAHIEMEKAVLAGMVAQQVTAGCTPKVAEEAVVCSILHTLGRMMVSFYMPERWQQLRQRAAGGNDDEAAEQVLGLSLERVGLAAARHWGLPANLISGMRRVAPGQRGDTFGHGDWLAAVSTMSSQCADALWGDEPGSFDAVSALAADFSAMLGIAPDTLVAAIEKAKVAAAADLSIAPLAKPAEKRALEAASTRMRAEGNRVLVSGVSDMRDVAASASPGQMTSMALETLYQGLSFTHAMAFMRNRRDKEYTCKMGFGDGVQAMMPDMRFNDSYEPNVFHAALNSDRVIFIENARDSKFAAKLPGWWKKTLSGARSFVILPLCANGQAVGFMYGDWDASFPAIQLSPAEFGLMNDLRALVMKAVERRRLGEIAALGRVS